MAHSAKTTGQSERRGVSVREKPDTGRKRTGRPTRERAEAVERHVDEIVRRRDRQDEVGAAIADLDVARREVIAAEHHVRDAELRLCAVCREDEQAIRTLRRANQIVCEHAA